MVNPGQVIFLFTNYNIVTDPFNFDTDPDPAPEPT